MSDNELQTRILQRLQTRTVGMTSWELARSLKLRPTDVTREFLELQKTGDVTVYGNRWRAAQTRGEFAGNVTTAPPRGPAQPLAPPQSGRQTASLSTVTPGPSNQTASRLNRRGSRWATFRRLRD